MVNSMLSYFRASGTGKMRPCCASGLPQRPCSSLAAVPRHHRYTTQVEDIWASSPKEPILSSLHEAKTPLLVTLTVWAAWSVVANWIRARGLMDGEAQPRRGRDSWGLVSPAERWASTYLGQAERHGVADQVWGGVMALSCDHVLCSLCAASTSFIDTWQFT